MEPLTLLATQLPRQVRSSELSYNQQINLQPLGVQADH